MQPLRPKGVRALPVAMLKNSAYNHQEISLVNQPLSNNRLSVPYTYENQEGNPRSLGVRFLCSRAEGEPLILT